MAIVRVNNSSEESGEEYEARLVADADQEFKILLRLLSSYWQSTVDGPNYARELKAMALALARLRISLGDIRNDTYYTATRTEFLYQVLTSVVFPNPLTDGVPDLQKTDIDFRTFLQEVISVYFKGSVPESVKKSVELITGGSVVVREAFLEGRKPGSGYDISDEYGFDVEVILPSPGNIDTFLADKNIRILLNIVRPAHTLYRIKYVLQDEYVGQRTKSSPGKVKDSMSFDLSNYGYEDFRKFFSGVYGVDAGGVAVPINVVAEDHSSDF
ncbi:MAG: hypothetical protein BWY99_02557 [Synergistetes bacterium ADurb.BinA166]|nr:MAG: hypothetical protein BWY99_02557 [Synergistetes bacterium ADurb.BinA166]